MEKGTQMAFELPSLTISHREGNPNSVLAFIVIQKCTIELLTTKVVVSAGKPPTTRTTNVSFSEY